MATERYGRWTSPLRAGDVAGAKVSLSELHSDGDALYWLESRPSEAGRVVLVRSDPSGEAALADHSPPNVSIRSRVHEYGGGAVCLVPGHGAGAFAYVDQADQRVWFCAGDDSNAETGSMSPRPSPSRSPSPLTPAPADGEHLRHGGLSTTPDGDWVLAVREHQGTEDARPRRSVVALPTRDGAGESTIVEGHDFFGMPRADPSGERVAVVAWDHPDMPWDASVLLVVPVTRVTARRSVALATTGPAVTVAGGRDESVGQPAWRADGTLRFVSDRRGWWQPYVTTLPPSEGGTIALTGEEAEFHGPDWVLGQATIVERPDGSLVARRTASGRDDLVAIAANADPDGQPPTPSTTLSQPCVSISAVTLHGEGLAIIGSTPETPVNVWILAPGESPRPLRPPASAPYAPDTGDVATAEHFIVTGRSGRDVYGLLYRPTRASHPQRSNDAQPPPAPPPPPLIVWVHGGPTAACQAGLDMTLQFFTTRGFAVACVDYAGSSGHGRAYRNALWGQWGVADAEDCLDAALHLARRGDVDEQRMAIRGGSAGGMTALNALAAGEGFQACASWYGVTDLLALVATTHDFEALYTDRLIGPLPEAHERYVERSPMTRARAMSGSVLLLQGTEDAVVPPDQAERMRAALEAAGRPCHLRFFQGEGHGFRRADTLTACLETELSFYLEQLGL